MKVRIEEFDVGPILGAVSANSARLWGRGKERRSDGNLRRAFGAAHIKQVGRPFGRTQYFKLNPVFDLTGVTVFQGLRPDTEYEYEIGSLFADAELDDLPAAVRPDWSDAHRATFRTASRDRNAPRSFVFGSCRYLLRLFGGSFFDGRGDKTFRSINRQIKRGRRTDQVLMLGDQIYADDLNFLVPDQGIDEYFKRYRDVFSQKHFAELVSRIPTYMTLDDHEIEDNWPARATGHDIMKKFPAAMHAYLTYQLSHSPLFPAGADGRLIEQPDRYWYQFQDGCCDFFIMDTRTERVYDDGKRIRVISDVQMDALKNWLADGSRRVKLVATSIPFFPDLEGTGQDRWDSFPRQRNEILDHIRGERIRRVVFLSGDVHSSMTAELRHPSDARFKAISIVSSPFYWPYRHSAARNFVVRGELKDSNGYRVRGGPVHSTDNFARVTVEPSRVRVQFFKRKGDPLAGARVHRF